MKRSVIMSRNLVSDNNNIYMYSPEEKLFLRMDNKCYQMTCIPMRTMVDFQDVDLCVYSGDRIISNEISGRNLISFSLEDGMIEKWPLGFTENNDQNVAALCEINGLVYVVGRNNKRIRIFDLKNGDKNEIKLPCFTDKSEYVNACNDLSNLWIVPQSGSEILCYEVLRQRWNVEKIEHVFRCVTCVVRENERIYILEKCGDVYEYNTKQKSLRKLLTNTISKGRRHTQIIISDECFTLLSGDRGYAERYSIQDSKLVESELFDESNISKERSLYGRFGGQCSDGEWTYIANRVYESYLRISRITGKWEWFTPIYPTSEDVVAACLSERAIIDEHNDYLKTYLKLI